MPKRNRSSPAKVGYGVAFGYVNNFGSVAGANEALARQLEARLVAEPGFINSSGQGIAYTIKVTNVGPHPATGVGLHLLDAAENRLGATVPASQALMSGADAVTSTAPPVAEVWLGPYGARVEWDGRGYHRETTGLELGRP